MPREWEQYIREQELANGPEDDEPLPPMLLCVVHGEHYDGGGFCGSCYVEDLQASEKLAAEWKKDEAAERRRTGSMSGRKERTP